MRLGQCPSIWTFFWKASLRLTTTMSFTWMTIAIEWHSQLDIHLQEPIPPKPVMFSCIRIFKTFHMISLFYLNWWQYNMLDNCTNDLTDLFCNNFYFTYFVTTCNVTAFNLTQATIQRIPPTICVHFARTSCVLYVLRN